MSEMSAAAQQVITQHARRVPDFPTAGVEFIDLTPVMADAAAFHTVISALSDDWGPVDLIAGLDARGFLLGAAVAMNLGVGVLAIRKAGKLPPPVHAKSYTLEYGEATLEIPADGVNLKGKRVLIVDDVLATGGTVSAATALLDSVGATVVGVSIVLEVPGLGGRDKLAETTVRCLATS